MNPLVEILKSCGDLFAHCLVIVDLESPERELIYVNDIFCELSGYKREEVIGRNCRFLQGEGTSVYTVDAIRSAIKEAQCCFQDILNFKKNGTPFWNRLVLIPVAADVLGVRYYVGIQLDITPKKEAVHGLQIQDYIARGTPTPEMIVKIKNPLSEVINSARYGAHTSF